MGKKVLGILVLAGIAILCVVGWQKYKDQQQFASGAVHCVGCMSPSEKIAFDRHNNGDDEADEGRSTVAQNDPSRPSVERPEPGHGDATTAPAKPSGVKAALNDGVAPSQPPTSSKAAPTPPAGTPAADSIAPNPPNGVAFAGSGPYQVYRQGNLTWRVDTTTGHSCILFATMEEWQKRIVMEHGCGRNA